MTSKRDSIHHYVFLLYVAGATPSALRIVNIIRRFSQTNLKSDVDLQVVDISQHPEIAYAEGMIATPTLVRHRPMPVRHFVGESKVIDFLEKESATVIKQSRSP